MRAPQAVGTNDRSSPSSHATSASRSWPSFRSATYDFAERLFDATRLGMRVIVAPSDVAPVEIAHPALFTLKSSAGAVAAARAAEANEAASKADRARLAAVTASREAARATMSARAVENLRLRAEAQLATAERAVTSAASAETKEQAEDAKAKAAARAAEIEAQLAAAKTGLQPKLDAAAAAREAAVAAEAAKAIAADAAHEMARALEPVSVFISRKTQRLYVRQAFQPILETPVTIQDADLPIGTHVLTAVERSNGEGDMRWSVVSMDGGHPDGGGVEPNGSVRWSRCGAHIDGPKRRDSSARPDRHSTGRAGSYRRDGVPTIFPDHLRRGVELGDRQRHGICGPHEWRAARRYQVPTPRSGGRSPLPASTRSRALFASTVRVAVLHLVSRAEGWRLDHYDDGGISGASLDRPALQALLAEVRAGKLDVVVMYKVDHLTRSLARVPRHRSLATRRLGA
jgi:hypothetical protein